MPYKDLKKRRECRRRWYEKNKESEKAHVMKRKSLIRFWFNNYKKGVVCSRCGEEHVATLDFHHHSDKKELGISKMVAEGYSIERIKRELQKCKVLCANCHRKVHFKNNKL